MSYLIEHIFDNEYSKAKLEYDKGESLDRLRRERSKSRITFKHSDGSLGEVFILSADNRNRQGAGDALMGFGCIPEGYKITTDKGDLDIKDVVENKIDCKILSFNHRKDRKEWKKIISYQKNKTSSRHLIEVDLGDRKIRCTNDHPVWVENKGYVRADKIRVGDGVWVDK
jgi:hypothetical protein